MVQGRERTYLEIHKHLNSLCTSVPHVPDASGDIRGDSLCLLNPLTIFT